jgi:hypothetical protein
VQLTVIKLFFKSLLLATLVALAACETTPPAQEMSDARQAIMVAREAGAAEHAADYLESARVALNKGEYHLARRNAKQAKVKALDALNEAEAAAAKD